MSIEDKYISLLEVTQIFNKDIHFYHEWSNLDDNSRERYIYSAMQSLDWMTTWCGRKAKTNQEYEFPRDFSACFGKQDINDIYYMNHLLIPYEIKKAVSLLVKQHYLLKKYQSISELQNLKVTYGGYATVETLIRNLEDVERKVIKLIYPFSIMGWSNM